MRNPNGYGCVYKLSGNRRKPYAARVTVGWELGEDGRSRQKYKTLGTYAKREEALKMLAAYHDDPHAIPNAASVSQIFDMWSDVKFETISDSGVKGYKAAWNWVPEATRALQFVALRKNHMQDAIDKCGVGWHTKKAIKTLFNQLYRYAIENDYVEKDYSQFVDLRGAKPNSRREPFSAGEIQTLWEMRGRLEWIDTVLILIYSGWRIGELLNMKTADVDLENWTMRGGSKTEAGKNRLVPIHTKIRPLVAAYYAPDRSYLLPSPEGDKPLSYYTYRDVYFRRIMEQLQMKHRPHDARHTFASLLDSAGANKLCIKRMMGHASKDITDQVYTHKDIDELRQELEKIT